MYGGGSSSGSTPDILQRWEEIQYSLKQKLILEDDFSWRLPSSSTVVKEKEVENGDKEQVLRYVGGVDVSCLKEDQSIACGTLVVLDLFTGKEVYHDSAHVKLHVPYIAGFLAFREAPVLVQLLDKMKKNNNPYYPQLVMVDGNGILHPRGFGLACHLGVLENLPTIGIGKKLHCVDGLTKNGVRKCLQAEVRSGENFITLRGRSGRTHGAAMKSTEGSVQPIFISIGHRVSLDTAIKVVKLCCKYRVPEPIRQADKRSRSYVQRPQEILRQLNCLNLEPSSSWETITGNPHFNDLGESTNQVQNGSAEVSQGESTNQVQNGSAEVSHSTCYGSSRGQGRRLQGRGRWQSRQHVENEGEGQRWQERGKTDECREEQSNGRGRGRGGTGQGRGRGRGRRFGWGNSCEYAWVRKDVA